ncbi:MAG: TetR/AcrR family transcriptional regulator [Alphaproteobacteria bacterium]|nr:TetR/AcrR family transcriptional regulator [Alphaproteobacteria bacterium]|tara:strand:+ start:7349 stop:8059 length:711 start_codon:yes stop_codon:yes gene_type:complete
MQTDIPVEKTPAGRRRKRVRDSIIAAAEKVFAREGESGLSIRRLAEEIDYSPSAIYKYFESKEELIDQLKEAFFERLMDRVDTSSNADRPFEDRARACLITYVETATNRPYHYAAAFSSIEQKDECTPAAPKNWDEFMTTNKGKAFSVLVNMVEEGQALGMFDRALEPVHAAKSLWASLHGLAQLVIHVPHFERLIPDDGSATTTDFITFHANLLIRGLQARPTAEAKDKQAGQGR